MNNRSQSSLKGVAYAAFTLTVLTAKNEAWSLWKRISKFWNSKFLLAVWSKLSTLITNTILR